MSKAARRARTRRSGRMTRGNGRAKVHGRREARSPRIRCDGAGNSSERGGAMVGVIVLLVIGFWAVVGRWAWKNFVRPHVSAPRAAARRLRLRRRLVRAAGRRRDPRFDPLPATVPGDSADPLLRTHRRRTGGVLRPAGEPEVEEQRRVRADRAGLSGVGAALGASDRDPWIASWPMAVFQARSLQIESSTGRVVVESYFEDRVGGGSSARLVGVSWGPTSASQPVTIHKTKTLSSSTAGLSRMYGGIP